MNQKLLGYYNYTVILTYLGMLVGFIGIIYATENYIPGALVCLMIAGLCDMFDGTIASTKVRTQEEKCFGIQIDSFSDLICFGVLPVMIVCSQNGKNQLVLIVCSLYLLCALIRLAYFNVDEQERQRTSNTSREVYHGLPVTLAAVFLPVVQGIENLLSCKPTTVAAPTLLAMSIMFLLPFPIRKPKLFGKMCVFLCGVIEFCLVLLACDGV